MPEIKEIARKAIRESWFVSDVAFDALWESFAHIPLVRIEHGNNSPTPLAATGDATNPAVIAVQLFGQLLEQLLADTEMHTLIPHIQAIAAAIDHKGIGIRLTKSLAKEYDPTTIVTVQKVPTQKPIAFCHEGSKRLTNEQAHDLYAQREQYALFLCRQTALPPNVAGRAYYNGAKQRGTGTCGELFLPLLQYRVLHHILRYHDSESFRTMAQLIRYCWFDEDRAVELEKSSKRSLVTTDAYRKGTGKLSKTLDHHLGVQLHTGGRGIYSITPQLKSFCVLEVQTELL